jgi:hypothetical protein
MTPAPQAVAPSWSFTPEHGDWALVVDQFHSDDAQNYRRSIARYRGRAGQARGFPEQHAGELCISGTSWLSGLRETPRYLCGLHQVAHCTSDQREGESARTGCSAGSEAQRGSKTSAPPTILIFAPPIADSPLSAGDPLARFWKGVEDIEAAASSKGVLIMDWAMDADPN